jgi:hypothetical protein
MNFKPPSTRIIWNKQISHKVQLMNNMYFKVNIGKVKLSRYTPWRRLGGEI